MLVGTETVSYHRSYLDSVRDRRPPLLPDRRRNVSYLKFHQLWRKESRKILMNEQDSWDIATDRRYTGARVWEVSFNVFHQKS